MRDDGLENAVRRALAAACAGSSRSCSSRPTIPRRSSPSATARRSSSASATASSSSPPTSRPSSATRATSCSSATRRWRSSRATGVAFTDFAGRAGLEAPTQRVLWDPVMAEKAGYKHFMLKEIFEQPTAARETILGRVSLDSGRVFLEEMNLARRDAARQSTRSPSSRAARRGTPALVGKFLIEQLARVPVEVDYGSEYRYRDPIVDAAARSPSSSRSRARRPTRSPRCARRSGRGARSIAICNVVGSMATRETDGTVYTHAGPGDRRRLDQGVHVAARRAVPARAVPRPGARHADRRTRRGRTSTRCCSCRTLLEQTLKCAPQIEEVAGALPRPHRLPLPRPRHQLPDRARGRAEAEGDLLHPRRGLSGRRDEARPDRAHRRADAGRRDRAARRTCSRRCSATCRRRRRAAARSSRSPRAGDDKLGRAARPRARRASSTLPRRARAAHADRDGACRCSCSRTTSPCAAAATSISRGISRRASRWNRRRLRAEV